MSKVGLVLEGGALRAIFVAGILDFFLDHGVKIDNIISVSAGSYVGMNYCSGQRGRIMETMVRPGNLERYVGLNVLLKKRTLFDMDYIFEQMPKDTGFDFEAFKKFDGKFVMGLVDIRAGVVKYYDHYEDEDEFFRLCKASNSLPLIARKSKIDETYMIDGGMGDAIPVAKALEMGCDKVIVVFTRGEDYRKRPKSLYATLTNIAYWRFPNFRRMVKARPYIYNNTIEKIAEMKEEGKAFIFRPTKVTIKNNETNIDTLEKYYQHGYDTAAEQYENLMEFLKD